jgi:FemAB-related protein (PEP-CTERM system-associated)
MTSELELRTDLDPARWDAFVTSQEHATHFQLYGWVDVISRAFGHRAHYLAALKGGEVAGVIPLIEIKSRLFGHALISTAFCVGGGPLAASAEALAALIARTEALGRELGVDYIEVRDPPAPVTGWTAKQGLHAGFERAIAADETACLLQIPRKQRAVVRKALECDLTFTLDRDLPTFYRLHARTFRNHGTPVYPRRFFEQILAVFGNACDILTVWDAGEPVSSVMSYYIRDRVTPYFTGSVQAARALGANDLMYWRLMRHAVARGCTSFDFGRSKLGSGPYAFKKNWGFEPRPITNWYFLVKGKALPNVSPANPKFSLAIKVWRALPLPAATFLSRFISPNIG